MIICAIIYGLNVFTGNILGLVVFILFLLGGILSLIQKTEVVEKLIKVCNRNAFKAFRLFSTDLRRKMLKQIIVNAHFMIPVYNLMCGIALITGLIYLEMEFERNVINHRFRDKIIPSIIITLLFSILGARLFDWFFIAMLMIVYSKLGLHFMGG